MWHRVGSFSSFYLQNQSDRNPFMQYVCHFRFEQLSQSLLTSVEILKGHLKRVAAVATAAAAGVPHIGESVGDAEEVNLTTRASSSRLNGLIKKRRRMLRRFPRADVYTAVCSGPEKTLVSSFLKKRKRESRWERDGGGEGNQGEDPQARKLDTERPSLHRLIASPACSNRHESRPQRIMRKQTAPRKWQNKKNAIDGRHPSGRKKGLLLLAIRLVNWNGVSPRHITGVLFFLFVESMRGASSHDFLVVSPIFDKRPSNMPFKVIFFDWECTHHADVVAAEHFLF
ncbi:hypothetical protein Efla_002636 [Eimeria flavescens]